MLEFGLQETIVVGRDDEADLMELSKRGVNRTRLGDARDLIAQQRLQFLAPAVLAIDVVLVHHWQIVRRAVAVLALLRDHLPQLPAQRDARDFDAVTEVTGRGTSTQKRQAPIRSDRVDDQLEAHGESTERHPN